MPNAANIAASIVNAEQKAAQVVASKAARKAGVPMFNKGEGLGSRTLGGMNSGMWKIRNWAWYTAFAAGALNWVAARTPVGKGVVASLAGILGKPDDLLNTTTVSDLSRTGSSILNSVGEFATKRGAAKAGEKLLNLSGKAGALENTVIGNVYENANGVFSFLSEKLERSGAYQWVVSHFTGKADKAAKLAGDAISKNADVLNKMASKISAESPTFEGIGDTLSNAINNANPQGVAETIAKLSNRASDAVLGPVLNEQTRQAAAEMAKELSAAAGKTVGKAMAADAKVSMWKSIPASLREGAGAISKMKTSELLQVGTMVAGTAMSSMSAAQKLSMQGRALSDMKEKLGADSPEFIAARKAHRLETIPTLGAQLASWITTGMQLLGKGSTKLFLLNTGLNMLSGSMSALTGPNPLQAWAHLSDTVNAGQATMQDYVHFLTAGPIGETRGVSPEEGSLQMLAEHYRAQGATPQELVYEARSGRLNDTALAIQRGETPEPMQSRVEKPAAGSYAARELERRHLSPAGKAVLIGTGVLAATAIGAAASSPELRTKMTKLFTDNISKLPGQAARVSAERTVNAAAQAVRA